MEHFDYLFAAYSIIFIVIFAYVGFMWRRQARMETELRAMEERIRTLQAPSNAASTKRAAEN